MTAVLTETPHLSYPLPTSSTCSLYPTCCWCVTKDQPTRHTSIYFCLNSLPSLRGLVLKQTKFLSPLLPPAITFVRYCTSPETFSISPTFLQWFEIYIYSVPMLGMRSIPDGWCHGNFNDEPFYSHGRISPWAAGYWAAL